LPRIERHAKVSWEGNLARGSGRISAGTGAFESLEYSNAVRIGKGNEGKTSPEELLAAAHAGCYSMALSSGLEKAGHPATRIETRAAVTIETVDGAPKITRSVLEVRGKVDGLDEAAFRQAAESAKKNCPVSKAIQGNVEITMDAKLA
jgi:osmotically inducible protein OsmC